MTDFNKASYKFDRRWHLGLMFGSTVLALLALGPGWYAKEVLAPYHLHYSFFSWLCHQDPTRSFDFMGTQMAVCSRCLGIYSSFALGFYLLMFGKLFGYQPSFTTMRTALMIALVLNGADIAANALNIWTNTLYSRLLLGILFGLSASVLLGAFSGARSKPVKFSLE